MARGSSRACAPEVARALRCGGREGPEGGADATRSRLRRWTSVWPSRRPPSSSRQRSRDAAATAGAHAATSSTEGARNDHLHHAARLDLPAATRRRAAARPLLAALLALVLVAALAPAAHAGRDTRPPRITGAALLDADRDGRADRLRITYDERVRHRRDADRPYSFRVVGRRIRAVGSARRNALVLVLVERAGGRSSDAPAVSYRRTRPPGSARPTARP